MKGSVVPSRAADIARLNAIRAMFDRHGYAANGADARARILYFMQLGYQALDLRKDAYTHMSRVSPRIHGFTLNVAEPADIEEFLELLNGVNR